MPDRVGDTSPKSEAEQRVRGLMDALEASVAKAKEARDRKLAQAPRDGCEYFVFVAESNREMCDRAPFGYVGVDNTPYCDLHYDEMQAREEAAT